MTKEAPRSRFVYTGRSRSVESVSRKSKQSSGAFDSFIDPSIPMFKAHDGENRVRILPPTWEDTAKWGDGWEIQVYLHYDVGPDGGSYLCLDKMKGTRCPVCEARQRASTEDEKNDLKPQWRALAWVIDRDQSREGPMVWSLPVTLFRDINTKSIDRKTGQVVLVDDPEAGYDMLFTKTGSKLRTKYTNVEVDRDPSTLADNAKVEDRWLAYIQDHPLPSILNFFEADYIEQVLYGRAAPRDPDDPAAEERPAARSRRAEPEEAEERPAARSRRAEPEPEEDDRRPAARSRRAEPEPEEAEERPRRRADPEPDQRSASRPSRRAEPEEEPEERPAARSARRAEPEEEPEERPAARSARRAEPEESEEAPAAATPARRRLAASAEPADERPTRRRMVDADEPADEASGSARDQLTRLREGRG